MSKTLELLEGEQVLTQDQALLFRGPLAHQGAITLTNRRLIFKALHIWDRWVGANELQIDVHGIERISVRGLDRIVSVHARDGIHRFGDPGAHRVLQRLEALMAEREAQIVEIDLAFEPGEQVLIHGPIDVHTGGPFSVVGEAVLTDRRIRVSTGTGFLATRIFQQKAFECRYAELQAVSLEGIRRRLCIRTDDAELTVGGRLVPQLYAHLATICATAAFTVDEPRVLECWDVQHHQGVRTIPGVVALSASHFQFTPKGDLDVMIGAKELNLPLSCLRRLRVKGWPMRRLIVEFSDESLTLGVDDPLAQFHDLVELVRMAPVEQFPLDFDETGAVQGDVDDFLGAWRLGLNDKNGETLLLLDRGLQWVDETHASVGWLALSTHRFFFLPIGGASAGLRAQAIPLEQLSRLDADEALTSTLRFEINGAQGRFTPQRGREFVVNFWGLCEAPMQDGAAPDVTGGQPLSRVLGDVRFLKLIHQNEELLHLTDAALERIDDGVAITIDRLPKGMFVPGASITIECGIPDGLFRFDTRVMRIESVEMDDTTAESDDAGPPTSIVRDLLIVEVPRNIQLHNRRSSFRVSTAMPITLQVLEHSESGRWRATQTISCRIDDLSIEGCAVASKEMIPDDARVSFELRLDEVPLEIIAQCVNSDKPDGPRKTWRHGIKFVLMSEDARNRIHKEILRRERALLKLRAQIRG